MRDKEDVRVIIVKRQRDGSCEMEVRPKDAISTRVNTGQLTRAIVGYLGLLEDNYDLYVKIPAHRALDSLNLDSLDIIAVLPGEPIYDPG